QGALAARRFQDNRSLACREFGESVWLGRTPMDWVDVSEPGRALRFAASEGGFTGCTKFHEVHIRRGERSCEWAGLEGLAEAGDSWLRSLLAVRCSGSRRRCRRAFRTRAGRSTAVTTRVSRTATRRVRCG